MTTAEHISNWINQQIEYGFTDSQIEKFVFVDGDDLWTLKKTRTKGMFDLKCSFNAVVHMDEIRETKGEN